MTPTVGRQVWFKHFRSEEPLAATITKVISDWTVNLLVLDNGEGILTEGMGAEPKTCVLLCANWSHTGIGECAWPDRSPS